MVEECAHHWLYGEPNGPTSEGTCLLCGATQEASNSGGGPDPWQHKGKDVGLRMKGKPLDQSRTYARSIITSPKRRRSERP